MYVVGHQTVSINIALRWERVTELIFGIDLLVEGPDKFPIVVTVKEDVLTIDATEHHMINASNAGCAGFACHSVSI